MICFLEALFLLAIFAVGTVYAVVLYGCRKTGCPDPDVIALSVLVRLGLVVAAMWMFVWAAVRLHTGRKSG